MDLGTGYEVGGNFQRSRSFRRFVSVDWLDSARLSSVPEMQLHS
jgi:hypothetical protein